ncbi:hypothetical protein DFQ28_003785 [Apophysomyces sp. BC1034]|nr:hypothetical protein DFQ30_011284 [Apophysomyces sp. BC1015]KAG0189164.1 hypothetical protein DFQ28_003785 [Apophysomyces sp. BC1034]
MSLNEDKVSEESKAIATRVHDLLNRHGVGKRQHAAEVQRIVGLSYSQAHRKMKGANPWTIAQVKAVAQAYGESAVMLLDGIDSTEPVASMVAKMHEAALHIEGNTYHCRADIGDRACGSSKTEFVAVRDGDQWNVFPVAAAPNGEHFVVGEILIRNSGAPGARPVIAILDDDPSLTAEMGSYLNSCGYVARPYNTEATFRAALHGNMFDGFIVDWMLEAGTAEQTIQSIRHSRHGIRRETL